MGEGSGERRRDRRLLVLVVSAMTEDDTAQGVAARIAAQNDAFRRHILRGAPAGTPPGRVMVTRTVEAKGTAFRLAAVRAVAGFDAFTHENDPNGEHEFGAVEIKGQTVWWKIDLYDPDLRFGSEAPGDPSRTVRVLTIMLPEDY